MTGGGSSGRERRASHMPLLGMLALLYFAQGLPSGLLGRALPPLLRGHGVSLSAIGFTALLALPWTLKFLWAPFLDRFWTRRRWLLALNLATCGLMLLVASRDFGDWVAQSFALLLAVLFSLNLVAATQDIATDGLAVSRLAPNLRGLGNSVQVIGYKTGMIVGGGMLLWLVAHFGWRLSYTALALLIVPVLLPVWFMRETPAVPQVGPKRAPWHGWRGYVRLFGDFLSRPRMGWWLVTVATFKAGDSLASRMIGPMLADQGLPLAAIGLLTGVIGAVAGLAGALLGGLLLLLIPKRQADWCKEAALGISLAPLLLCALLLMMFPYGEEGFHLGPPPVSWIPALGIDYRVGVDGLSLLLVVLTTLLSSLSILASFDSIQKHLKEYYFCMLLLETGMLGTFIALDLFLFYLFWELMLVPMYFIIGVWGGRDRIYAGIKFFLYTAFGSALMLIIPSITSIGLTFSPSTKICQSRSNGMERNKT